MAYTFSAPQGGGYWASEDVNTTINPLGSNQPGIVRLADLNTSGWSDLTVSLYLADNNNGTNMDGPEMIEIQAAFDGNTGGTDLLAGTYTTIGRFVADTGALQQDIDLDGFADLAGPELTSTFTEFTFDVPGTGNLLSVQILIINTSGSEEVAFDRPKVDGLQLACPDSVTLTCADQATIDAQIQTWANSFAGSFAGGCNPVITYTVNGAGPFTPAELPNEIIAVTPQECTGGTVTVVCTLTDDPPCSGSQCISAFIVEPDDEAPVPDCSFGSQLSDAVVDANCENALADYTVFATATDNCTDPNDITFSQDPPPGTITGIGQVTVTITATDNCGNAGTCTFVVNVVDATPPEINCPDDITVEGCGVNDITNGGSTALPYSPGWTIISSAQFNNEGGSWSDNCPPQQMIRYMDFASGICPVDVVRLFEITDQGGNTDTCTQSITIDDTIPPTITCPDDITIECG
ncbi:MAG: HYR domain-containing protein, partial [Saprospiraceae bacterium]|nr:HYR domain-containing protein [Saprospiraceae bacterium]